MQIKMRTQEVSQTFLDRVVVFVDFVVLLLCLKTQLSCCKVNARDYNEDRVCMYCKYSKSRS